MDHKLSPMVEKAVDVGGRDLLGDEPGKKPDYGGPQSFRIIAGSPWLTMGLHPNRPTHHNLKL